MTAVVLSTVAPGAPAHTRALVERIAADVPHGTLGVAFSGGVDSTVLLAAAQAALGPRRVLAVLGVSPSLAADERMGAHQTAAELGVPVLEVQTFEGEQDAYRANGPDRCYFCKSELFGRIDRTVVERFGLSAVAYGENLDDADRIDRPGVRAADEHRVLRPLVDAGLRKLHVREAARYWQLSVAEKPAAPCLASRIPHGQQVTPEKLHQIDRAESALRALGFDDLRVRHHGAVARIEVPSGDLERLIAEPVLSAVRHAVRDCGFAFATLDLGGLQSGAFTLRALAGG